MSESKILLVEDDADDVAFVMRALAEIGVDGRVVVKRDGADALAYLRGDEPLPAVVLLDLCLPGLDGKKLIKPIRSHDRTAAVPVVILTSSREESDIMRSYATGVNSFVQKPVDLESFEEAVRRLALYWLDVNKPPAAESGAP